MSEVLQKPGTSPANAYLSDVIMTGRHQYSQHQRNHSTGHRHQRSEKESPN